MVYTTIQIGKRTRELIKELRITKLETYDEILLRLIKNYKEKKTEVINLDPDPLAMSEHS